MHLLVAGLMSLKRLKRNFKKLAYVDALLDKLSENGKVDHSVFLDQSFLELPSFLNDKGCILPRTFPSYET